MPAADLANRFGLNPASEPTGVTTDPRDAR